MWLHLSTLAPTLNQKKPQHAAEVVWGSTG